MAKNIYKTVGCSGIARVDFLYDKVAGKVYANEINPMPGTVYHHLWKASGIELAELLKRLIEFAKEKHESKSKIQYTFESNILKHANSIKLKMGE
jgi:D-alanine-D-alanine ligase